MVIMAAGLLFCWSCCQPPSDLNIILADDPFCGAGFGLFQSPNNTPLSLPRRVSAAAAPAGCQARRDRARPVRAALVSMLNQFGDSGTHLLLAAAIPATRGGSERFTYYGATRSK